MAELVGRDGPETIVPTEPGTIIPNDKLTLYQQMLELIRGANQKMDPTRLMPQAGPMTGSTLQDLVGSLPLAAMGTGARVHLAPRPVGTGTNLRAPGAQGMQFQRQPFTGHPARGVYPAVAAGQIAGIAQSGAPEATAGQPPLPAEQWPVPTNPAPEPEMGAMRPMSVGVGGESGKRPASEGGQSAKKPAKRQAPSREPTLMEKLAALLPAGTRPPGRNATPGGHYEFGGRPPVGWESEVGESGPEAFVPDRDFGGHGFGGHFGGMRDRFDGGAPDSFPNTPNSMQSLFGNGGGNFSSLLASLFSGGKLPGSNTGSTSGPFSFLNMMGLKGFEKGGRPEPGEPAVVGEGGEEAFVPDSDKIIQPAYTKAPAHQVAKEVGQQLIERSPLWAAGSALGEQLRTGQFDPQATVHAAGDTMIDMAGPSSAKVAGPVYAALPALMGMMDKLGIGKQARATEVDPLAMEAEMLQRRIGKNQDEVVRLGTTKTPSPKGTQATTIDVLKGVIQQDQQRLVEIQGMLKERDAETTRLAETKRQSEMPFQERFAPYSYAAPFVGPVLGAATGYGIGRYGGKARAQAAEAWNKTNATAEKQFEKKGGMDSPKAKMLAGELESRAKSGLPGGKNPLLTGAAGGAAAGALESAAVPYFTNEYDASTLPMGSKNQQTAQNNPSDLNWWLSRVALPAGMGTAMGALGGLYGAKRGGPVVGPIDKTTGLLDAYKARQVEKAAIDKAAAEAAASKKIAAIKTGVPPALGPEAWMARQVAPPMQALPPPSVVPPASLQEMVQPVRQARVPRKPKKASSE